MMTDLLLDLWYDLDDVSAFCMASYNFEWDKLLASGKMRCHENTFGELNNFILDMVKIGYLSKSEREQTVPDTDKYQCCVQVSQEWD